jgi:hypothetical protein
MVLRTSQPSHNGVAKHGVSMSNRNAAIDAAIAEFLAEGGTVREHGLPTEKDEKRAAWLDRLIFM